MVVRMWVFVQVIFQWQLVVRFLDFWSIDDLRSAQKIRSDCLSKLKVFVISGITDSTFLPTVVMGHQNKKKKLNSLTSIHRHLQWPSSQTALYQFCNIQQHIISSILSIKNLELPFFMGSTNRDEGFQIGSLAKKKNHQNYQNN